MFVYSFFSASFLSLPCFTTKWRKNIIGKFIEKRKMEKMQNKAKTPRFLQISKTEFCQIEMEKWRCVLRMYNIAYLYGNSDAGTGRLPT